MMGAPIALKQKQTGFDFIQLTVVSAKGDGNWIIYIRNTGIQVEDLINNRITEDCE